jgi:RNA recognition motif-containing protein
MNIFVGNLSYRSTEEGLRTLFEPYGDVDAVRVIKDRDTGQSRGFGFVEMPNDDEARAAIAALNGTDFDGRTINANEARPREDRGGGGYNRRPSPYN